MTEHEQNMVAEFLAAVRSPIQIDRLTKQETKLVKVLGAAKGSILSDDFLSSCIATDEVNPPQKEVVSVIVHRIRKKRPDITINTIRGFGRRIVHRGNV